MREMNGRTHVEPGIAAVIFDWAGTIVDFGCFAPAVSIVETFAQRRVTLTLPEARGPMGLEKREHLRRLLEEEDIRRQWKEATGADPHPWDADALYEELEPRLVEAVKRHSAVIPGAKNLVDELRSWGIRIGSTTGYLRPIMDIVTEEASRQGFLADAVVCPSDVPAGRPWPWMCFLNAISLGVCPPRRLVKIGDSRRCAGRLECRHVDRRGDPLRERNGSLGSGDTVPGRRGAERTTERSGESVARGRRPLRHRERRLVPRRAGTDRGTDHEGRAPGPGEFTGT